MKLDKHLNLVVPVEREGTTIYVHSTPISKEVFDQYWLVISMTFTSIYSHRLGPLGGPRVASKFLLKVAEELGPNQADEVRKGLMPEMRRLSNVIVAADRGWTSIPLDEAIKRDLLDEDDVDEVENAITFFILASAMHKKKDAKIILTEAAKLWSAQTTYLNSTAFVASLPTSTPPVSSGEKAPPSSIPS